MAKSLVDMRTALAKVEVTNEAIWTKENFPTELTRALTVIENARMEWNSARLKFPVLSGAQKTEPAEPAQRADSGSPPLANQSFSQLCKLSASRSPGRCSSR